MAASEKKQRMVGHAEAMTDHNKADFDVLAVDVNGVRVAFQRFELGRLIEYCEAQIADTPEGAALEQLRRLESE